DGMKIMPVSAIPARFWAARPRSAAMAAWTPGARARGPSRRPGGTRPGPGGGGPRVWPASRARGRGDPTRDRARASRGGGRRGRHNVADGGVDVDHAKVGHAASAAALDDQIARLERVLGGGGEAVAAAFH